MFQTLDPQGYQIINLHCFTPICLWAFVMAAYDTNPPPKCVAKNNYSVGIWEKGGKDIIFRKNFTGMEFELALKGEGI